MDEYAETAAASTRAMYAAPNRLTTHRVVPLDLPVADSMRAPGDAVGQLALEQAMDELAYKLDLDPIELRLRNEPTEDPEKHVPFSTRTLVACLQKGAEKFGWEQRPRVPGTLKDGQWLIGLGMSAAIRPNLRRPATAKVRMDEDRQVTVEMDMTDIGTGSYTIFAQVAAETLDLPVEKVTVKLGHSSYRQDAGLRRLVRRGELLLGGARGLPRAQEEARRRARPGQSAGGSQGAPGEEFKKFSQHSYGAHFAEVGVDSDDRRGPAAPHARRVRCRAHPQPQDRALAADRRHDLGRGLGAA